jgi:hypothetical protein
MMRDHSLVYPMFAMVLLAFSVLVRLFRARKAALASGSVTAGYFKTYQVGAEPAASAQLARNFSNQFEAPVLFYAACVTALALQTQSAIILGLAWAYVVLRVVHCYIHTGTNKLMPRVYAYFLSWIALLALWGAVVVVVVTD